MMNPRLRLPLLCLACLLGSCGPATNQATTPETATADPADSVPADGTKVADEANGQAGAAAALPGPDSLYRIGPSHAGPIKIGMPVADLKQIIPAGQLRETTLHLEGEGFKAYEIGPPLAGVVVEEKCDPGCRVWRIQVRDPAYRTAEGLGVGSRLGEVKKHYPISFLGSGETEIVAVSRDQKITFMLDVSQLPPQQVPRLNLQNTPDSVKVLGMLIL